LLLAVAAAVLVGFVAAIASAGVGPDNSPVITFVSPPSPNEGATLTTTDAVSFSFTYNRKPAAKLTLTCTLAGPTASSGDCDAPVASGTKNSLSGKSYTGLADGSYTFTVTVTLTDGGAATSETRHFTLNVPHDRIFWGTSGALGRANRDGTNVNKTFMTGVSTPLAIATDSNYIYWVSSGSTISRANLDGTGLIANFITGAEDASGIAVNGTHIYWSNYGANEHLPPYGTIGRANLDGTDVNQSLMTGIINPVGLAVDANYLYYSQSWNTQFFNGKIGRAGLDGLNANPNFIDIGNYNAGDVEVDAGYIYWSNNYSLWGSPMTIGRANVDGSNVNSSFIQTIGNPWGVAVDSGYVYWTMSIPFISNMTIGRASLDGSGINNSFITGLFHPTGLALGNS
jgi:virginiamycin B lyase